MVDEKKFDRYINTDIGDIDCIHNKAAKDFKMGVSEWFGALLMLGLLIIVIVIGVTSYLSRNVSQYFVRPTGTSGDAAYYGDLSLEDEVQKLSFFDFKGYLQYRATWRLCAEEVTYREQEIDGVAMGYSVEVGKAMVYVQTTCSDSQAMSQIRIETVDSKGEPQLFCTELETVDMKDAVYDEESAFFCGRKTFMRLVALLESKRLERYPDSPFVGLMDEAAPEGFWPDLLKEFFLCED